MMRNSLSTLAPRFTTGRMMDEYVSNYYVAIAKQAKETKQDDFRAARTLAAWKRKVSELWDNVQVISTQVYDSHQKAFPLGEELRPTLMIDTAGLDVDEIGVEMVFIDKRRDEQESVRIISSYPMEADPAQTQPALFRCSIPVNRSGIFEYGFRVFPKHPLLVNRLDFPLVKWA